MSNKSGFDTSYFVQLIENRLKDSAQEIAQQYQNNRAKYGIGFAIIDKLLPESDAHKISQAFDANNKSWREMDSFREKKLTTKQYQDFDKILGEITFAFQHEKVVNLVSEITGIKKQIPDSHLYAGGLSMMRKGDFLDPHIDNSHDQSRKYYRRLNLLYYVSENWALNDGGHLQLWDKKVQTPITLESYFNRLVLMETHKLSWHSVSTIEVDQKLRKCVSNYYFSEESPSGGEYYHVTSFMAKPDQVFKRLFCRVDNFARSIVRKVKPSGLGRKDLYQAGADKK